MHANGLKSEVIEQMKAPQVWLEGGALESIMYFNPSQHAFQKMNVFGIEKSERIFKFLLIF